MMEKSCLSSASEDSTTNNSTTPTTTTKDHYLKHLNKISHKISKPIKKTPLDHPHLPPHHQPHLQQPPPPPQLQNQQQQQQQQPPVYNINKSEFRDVVQKLTGSPAHDRFSTPPPIHPPKPPSSRLQRIRPPPLAHVTNRPPLPLNNPILPPPVVAAPSPLSPLPPFPAVHIAAESPISAYMRYLHTSISANSFQLQPQQAFRSPISAMATTPSQFLMPLSPLAFGTIPSPRSPYPMLSPTLLFPPSTGQLGFPQFPPSPSLSVPSPQWRDL